jgi:iron complex outermembrane receptor protein
MKHHFTKIFFTLILIISANALFAQAPAPTAKVSGTLLDTKTQGVGYATVSLLRAKDSTVVKGTLSTNAGAYVFDRVAAGTYVVRATSAGYNRATSKAFTITNADIAVSTLTMAENVKSLGAVNITASKPLIERKIDRTVMNVENSVLAAGNSAMEILERAPGVTIDKDDNISLKGKQGVTVMINDKLTYLSSAQLANLLRSTDGNSIQSIEIITNPSAKYDASGNSGILNIKLKKNNQSGTNGSLTAMGGYGNYPKNNLSLTLNHKQGKLNVFANVSHGDNQRYQSLLIKRTVLDASNNATYFNQNSFIPRINHNNNYRLGADYDLSPKHTIGFVVNGYFNSNNEDVMNINRIGTTPATADSYQNTLTTNRGSYKNFAVNLNDKYKIDTLGQTISFDVDYSKFNNNTITQLNTNFFLNNGSIGAPSIALRNQSPSTIRVFTAKTDYAYPLSKTVKLEAGLKYSNVETDNDFRAQKLVGADYVNDPIRANHFIYNEQISAGYLNLSKTYKSTSIQLGVRAEYTSSTGNLLNTGQVVPRDYLNFFPSMFINQTLSPKHDIGFSYSRRINRPGYDNLNPFVFYLDQFTYSQGNPFLKPEYTNNFEVNYTYNKMVNLALSYSVTNDVITQILLTDVPSKSTYQTYLNLQTQKGYNASINTPYTIAKWFTGNINLVGFYMKFKSDNLLGANYNKGSFAYQAKITQNISFAGFRAEIAENYQSALIYGLFDVRPQYAVDAGISRAFADKKWNVKLGVNDVFNIRTNDVNSNYQTNILQIKQKNETRVARLTVTYNFGNSKIKARNHQTGSSDESRRVNSGN